MVTLSKGIELLGLSEHALIPISFRDSMGWEAMGGDVCRVRLNGTDGIREERE